MTVDDDKLMERFITGDAIAFDELFSRYHRLVFNYAHMVLGDRAAAEDILQETFIAAARGAARYECRGQFRAWLMTICRHRVLALLERRKVRDRLAEANGFELLSPTSFDSPWSSFDRQEQVQNVLQCMNLLPIAQREALSFYALQDMNYAEIADVLEKPINTVKTLIRRGRLELARACRAQNGGNS